MQFTAGMVGDMGPALYEGLARYRHKVFVETLGWELRTRDGLECDQFDRDDTVYVVAQDGDGHINGCARLLPTTRPYLLGDVFPELMDGLPLPAAPEVWELSRFAVMDFNAATQAPQGQFSSPVAVGLLRAALASARRRGADRVVTVSPVGIERLLRVAGFRVRRAAMPKVINGHPLTANWIEC